MPASASPPVQPAAPPLPPPPASPAPPEEVEATAGSPSRASAVGTVNWGTATLVGVFAGLLYGGSREASASVSKDAEVMLKMGSTTDKREQYRLMRDAMEKRFIRVAKGSLVGVFGWGCLLILSLAYRTFLSTLVEFMMYSTLQAAGSATAAAFGLILPGSMMWRARNVLVGSALGAGICYPLGWVQLKLAEKANLEIANSKPSNDLTEGKGNQTRVGAAIERLEGSLKK
ncbi:unnamed protein product [Miscanthus lutarioriparius]|uniref:Complex I assembly factor TIMMDC1, mitochondrial n=1 Tax=Miscanthus lutarioriparius TaxID=422564 RepID=A0A811PGW4_9POAL|nr:unnamed protein product [Miscanthus lutarioriparius]